MANEETPNTDLVTEPIYETVEKITPGPHDVSWWIKWGAVIVGILGAISTAIGSISPSSYLADYNIALGLCSLIGWAYVGMIWRDNAIIVFNVFLAGVYLMALLKDLEKYLV